MIRLNFQFPISIIFQGNVTFPRGAGRAKLFRPELFNKLTLNSSGEETRSSADSSSDNHSTVSAESEETKKIDKAGTKGEMIFDCCTFSLGKKGIFHFVGIFQCRQSNHTHCKLHSNRM